MLENILNTHWDFIIIGTGISGGTAGYALAKKGKRVLFIEKGKSRKELKNELIAGEFPEERQSFIASEAEKIKTLKSALRCSTTITDSTNPENKVSFVPLIGSGVGGSSTIYGAALERFFPEDFTPTTYFSHLKDANIADWPISFNDLEKYYQEAEVLYDVYGGVDPLRDSFQSKTLKKRKLSPVGEKVDSLLRKKNLHPYHLPVGHPPHHETTCEGCQATLCLPGDKKGSYEACIQSAIDDYGATLLEDCEVLSIDHTEKSATAVLCEYKGKLVSIHGNKFILAAGTLFTPAILLKSKSKFFKQGLANNSGVVGKNLCRHYFDLAMINLNPHQNMGYHEKELAFNDFYIWENEKLGTVQSLSNPPHFLSAYHEMHAEKKYHGIFYSLYLLIIKLFGRRIYNKMMHDSLCFAVIMEDVSYLDNRIEVDENNNINLFYKMRPESFKRLKIFRNLIKKSFSPYKVKFHPQAQNNQRLAHATGTCRMGTDPKKSVVDKM
ncbi:MAG: GMC family oxidoreductase N-terminal domain-containing protein, partial [Bdellovibrionales bacterium]|nr:GMC family oxidoreductase N-terminal domain-containing protein [Bdellovibrionales bacterium]